MSERSTVYTAAPIVEAVVQFTLVTKLTDRNAEALSQKLKRFYHSTQIEQGLTADVDMHARKAHFSEEQKTYRLSSKDWADVLLIRNDALIFSRLAPYEGWEHFVARIKHDQKIIYDALGFQRLSRMSLRYINRIDVSIADGRSVRPMEYLNIYPVFPLAVGSVVNTYALTIDVSAENPSCRVVINGGIAPPVMAMSVALLLDIDVMMELPNPVSLEKSWDLLEQLRDKKNKIFESAITEKTRSLIK